MPSGNFATTLKLCKQKRKNGTQPCNDGGAVSKGDVLQSSTYPFLVHGHIWLLWRPGGKSGPNKYGKNILVADQTGSKW